MLYNRNNKDSISIYNTVLRNANIDDYINSYISSYEDTDITINTYIRSLFDIYGDDKNNVKFGDIVDINNFSYVLIIRHTQFGFNADTIVNFNNIDDLFEFYTNWLYINFDIINENKNNITIKIQIECTFKYPDNIKVNFNKTKLLKILLCVQHVDVNIVCFNDIMQNRDYIYENIIEVANNIDKDIYIYMLANYDITSSNVF